MPDQYTAHVRVDGNRIRREKVEDWKISRYVRTWRLSWKVELDVELELQLDFVWDLEFEFFFN